MHWMFKLDEEDRLAIRYAAAVILVWLGSLGLWVVSDWLGLSDP